MRVTTSITSDDLVGIGQTAALIEANGFDGVNAQENRHDPFVPLTLAAAATSRIALATNVAIAFPRSPMVVANVAWDLQALSGGRFVLGLGSQVRGHNIRRFSVPWTAPAPRLQEYVESIKAIFNCWTTGDKLAYEGEHYQFSLMTPNFTPPALLTPPPPIHIAAVGPAMLRVAGRVCDGAMLHPFCTRAYLEEVTLATITGALQTSGRDRRGFHVTGGGFVATGATDEQVDKQLEWIRQRVGFYGSTPAYHPVFAHHGLEDLGTKLNAMSKAGEWDNMTQAIDDDVLSLFCARGRHDEIAGAIESHFGGLIDTISVDAAVPPDVIQDIQAVSSPN